MSTSAPLLCQRHTRTINMCTTLAAISASLAYEPSLTHDLVYADNLAALDLYERAEATVVGGGCDRDGRAYLLLEVDSNVLDALD